jgi:hypothetical protein
MPAAAEPNRSTSPTGKLSLQAGQRLLVVGMSLLLAGCATVSQIRALDDVEFEIAGISELHLGGVNLSGLSAFRDLSLSDGAAIADAWQSGDLPLEIEIEIRATNPPENQGDARMVRMDWTLFIEDRETVSGVVEDETIIPNGESTIFPLNAELNVVEFYEGNARDLFEMALSLAGVGGEPKEIELTALPVVESMFGPITYERPIRIVRTTVGR